MSLKSTGRLPSGEYLKRLKQSPNYRGKGFSNLTETPMIAEDASYFRMICDFFSKNKNTAPPNSLPSIKTDLASLKTGKPVIIWFGHSSYFIRMSGKNILVDPVFSGNAAPFSFMVKAFPGSDIYKPSDMPEIDYLVLTHDHYDHLDYKTIRALKTKVKKVYCSLGLGAHLIHWGIDSNIIQELDWWQSAQLDNKIKLTAAPARHFSGRGIKRFQTLWSSFILNDGEHNLFLGGDSGYETHFKTIGEKYGPFDIALLEAGQYNMMWPNIHMMPEETVQAAIDLKAKVLMPVHWGKFSLAMHEWNEPVKRVKTKAADLNLKIVTPRIGEPLVIGEEKMEDDWWEL